MLQWPPGALGQLKLFITKAPRIQSSQPRHQPGFCHIPPSSHTEQLPLLTACHILSGLRAFAHAVPSTWITLYLTTPHVSFHFLTVTSPGKCWVHPKLTTLEMMCLSLFLLDYKGYKRQLVPFTAPGTMPGTKQELEVDFLDFNLNDAFFTFLPSPNWHRVHLSVSHLTPLPAP